MIQSHHQNQYTQTKLKRPLTDITLTSQRAFTHHSISTRRIPAPSSPASVDMSIFPTTLTSATSISSLQDAIESMTLNERQQRRQTPRGDGRKRSTSTSRARRCWKSGDEEDENSDPCKLVCFLASLHYLGRSSTFVPETWLLPCHRRTVRGTTFPQPQPPLELVDRSRLTTNRLQCMGNKLSQQCRWLAPVAS